MTRLQDRLNQVFQNQLGSMAGEESLAAGSFVPAVDIYEDDKAVQLKVEIPGIDEKDLHIQVENNVLTVQGERKVEKEFKQEGLQRIERSYGSFARSFTLPSTVDTESVAANYDKGVLSIRIAKKPEAQPKRIAVSLGSPKGELKQ
jgi:HSP20 family protein